VILPLVWHSPFPEPFSGRNIFYAAISTNANIIDIFPPALHLNEASLSQASARTLRNGTKIEHLDYK
jgi:hypothetical protein